MVGTMRMGRVLPLDCSMRRRSCSTSMIVCRCLDLGQVDHIDVSAGEGQHIGDRVPTAHRVDPHPHLRRERCGTQDIGNRLAR